LPIELRHLRYLLAAAEHKSLRKAAESLNLKQSTLSRSIRELESELRVPLFERRVSGAVLSAAGFELLGYAREILQDLEIAKSKLRRHSSGERGQLALGFYTCCPSGSLREIISDYFHRFPEINLITTSANCATLLSALSSGALDIVIATAYPSNWQDRSLPLWSERIIVAIPSIHPLAERANLQWSELHDEVFLFSSQDPGPELQSLLMSQLSNVEKVPRIMTHDGGMGDINGLVAAGLGISLVWECCAGTQTSGVVYRELQGVSGSIRFGFIAHWRGANINPALQSFLSLVRERYPDLSPAS